MTTLVTGGCGFIGSHLVDRLLESGHRVAVLDNLTSGKKENLHPGAVLYQADIRDPSVEDILSRENPDILFHLAAQVNVRDSAENPLRDSDINICGGLNVVLGFLKAGKPGRKLIFSSTGGAMYGETGVLPTPESVEPWPISPYGVAKLAVEKYLFYFSFLAGLDAVCLRYANVYGPRQNAAAEAGVVAIFAETMLQGKEPVIYGDGEQTRDFVHVRDVVEANILAMTKSVPGPINIGSGTETSINRIFDCVSSLTGCSCRRRHAAQRKGEVRRSCLDIRKACSVMGWKPTVPLSEGLRETVEWFRNRQGGKR